VSLQDLLDEAPELQLIVNSRVGAGGHSLLHVAAAGGSTDICELLLKHGADLTAAAHDGGATPLILASARGCVDTVRLLLSAPHVADGARLRAQQLRQRTAGGESALHAAAKFGHTSVVGALLAAGSDADARAPGSRNMTALMFACNGVRALAACSASTLLQRPEQPACSGTCRGSQTAAGSAWC